MNVSGVEIHLSDGKKEDSITFSLLFLFKMLRNQNGKIYPQTFWRRQKLNFIRVSKKKKLTVLKS